jgi:hypothetical protein
MLRLATGLGKEPGKTVLLLMSVEMQVKPKHLLQSLYWILISKRLVHSRPMLFEKSDLIQMHHQDL